MLLLVVKAIRPKIVIMNQMDKTLNALFEHSSVTLVHASELKHTTEQIDTVGFSENLTAYELHFAINSQIVTKQLLKNKIEKE